MHPALSVIFFTVSSGLGYGLLALTGAMGAMGYLPASGAFGFTAIGLALAAVTAGLLSSTFHLGHPERAWRAFSQWRTSWLSREGVAAVITYVPAVGLAAVWMWPERVGVLNGVVGWTSALMAVVTVYCTAMIYRSLETIPEWANTWTVVNYMTISIASGAVWLIALVNLFGAELDGLNMATVGVLVLAWGFKLAYWRHIDTAKRISTPETATGLGRFGRVTHLEAPHTEQNYLLQEMGYQVARRHAVRLRIYAQVLGFLGPAVLLFVASYLARRMPLWPPSAHRLASASEF